MKRSEMGHKIIDVIEKHLVNVQLPENVTSYIAWDILDVIEKAGMLPPKVPHKSFQALSLTQPAREWEKE